MLLETSLQGVLIFFTPRALRLLGALGNAPIVSTAPAHCSTFPSPHEPTLEPKGL